MFNKKFLMLMLSALLVIAVSSQDKKPATISGVVSDAQSKTPITEAVITLSSNSFTGQKFAVTDSAGTYHVNNLPAGNYTIVFEMEGYQKFSKQNIDIKEGIALAINYYMIKEGKKKGKTAVTDSLFINVKGQ